MTCKRVALKGSSKEGSHVKFLIIKYVDVNMHTFLSLLILLSGSHGCDSLAIVASCLGF